jgi:hypothetical protein
MDEGNAGGTHYRRLVEVLHIGGLFNLLRHPAHHVCHVDDGGVIGVRDVVRQGLDQMVSEQTHLAVTADVGGLCVGGGVENGSAFAL